MGSPNKLDRASLRRARDLMLKQGEIPMGYLVSTVLTRSWRRSVDAGLVPDGRLPDPGRLSDSELARITERQHELIAHARPVMEYLHAQTRNSGSMIILSDDKGVLLQALGDPDFLTRAERVTLSPGASWNERHRGTNAIGTALAEGQPVVVHGGEHFLERNGFLSCASAPLTAPDGRILGVLDISGDERQHHPHTFGLIRAAAHMVENRLFDAHHARSLRLRLHPMAEGIGTFAEGIVALTEDGWLVGANPAGLALLGLHAADLRITPLERLLQPRLADLLDWNRRCPGEPMLVSRTDGERLFVRVDPPLVVRSGTPAPIASPAASEPPRSALKALDTGDERVSAAIEKAQKLIGKPISLLLQGEPGVGKERFARAVHASGPRQDGPFISVNLAALQQDLIETSLFGFAPTLCREGAPGYIREANNGTLFLDRIEAIPKSIQARFLKVLLDRRVTPLGGETEPVDFVLISATHANLKAEIEAGRFDADLYYRINGLTLQLAPLRQRKDLAAIVVRMLEELAPGRPLTLEPAVATAFAEYAWPGNLRQMTNALSAAIALLDADETRIGWNHLADDLVEEMRWRVPSTSTAAGEATENLRELSQATIRRAIALSHGNMSEAARRLGISRNTLYRRMQNE
ncbi:sigma-54-dependent Fis family transcriptional regulator [uncultured Propionivibrio sp.]|uniref:sigma-54-dependent Fis family transcriptional regulator n=1 Tax=uncultured Propionivibrio sp. TaxID=426737 RepID=UPI0029BFF4E1|nr:sigma-54-dependent Fis family transcriptional regulator [uncultured Propionivibrio sp.]